MKTLKTRELLEKIATMEEITASSQVLADQAGKLRELVKHFKV